MNLAHKAHKVVITGMSGTGKSTFLHRFVENSFRSIYSHVLIFDHQGEFGYRLGVRGARTVEELDAALETGMVVFDPSQEFPGDTENGWNFFCEWSFRFAEANLKTGKKLLVCDELQVMASTSEQPFEISLVIETGRRYQLDFAGVSQQLNLLHNRMRNQVTELVAFRQTEKLILDVLEKKGFDIAQVQALLDGHFIWKNFATGEDGSGSIDLASNAEIPKQTVDEGREIDQTSAVETETES
jgi:GTPase SAR1 family protein